MAAFFEGDGFFVTGCSSWLESLSELSDDSDEDAFFPGAVLTCTAFGFSSSEELSELSSDESPAFFTWRYALLGDRILP